MCIIFLPLLSVCIRQHCCCACCSCVAVLCMIPYMFSATVAITSIHHKYFTGLQSFGIYASECYRLSALTESTGHIAVSHCAPAHSVCVQETRRYFYAVWHWISCLMRSYYISDAYRRNIDLFVNFTGKFTSCLGLVNFVCEACI